MRVAAHSPAPSEVALPPFGERDVIQHILLLRQPSEVARWWASDPGENLQDWSHPLSQWEHRYLEAMSAETVPEAIRMWPLVTPQRLTPEQTADMEARLGTGAAAAQAYAHWENRRRIVKHYVLTHPTTVQLSLGLYELARDFNPLFFALERGWQMGSGQELFTSREVSQLGAAQEFFTVLATGVAAGKLMTATRPVPGWGVPAPGEPVGPGQGEGSARSAASRGACSRTRSRACSKTRSQSPLRRLLQNPLPRQHRPLRRRAPSRPLQNWSTRSRARTPRRRCLPSRACVRTPPSSRRCQTYCQTDRPISPNPRQNAQLQRDIKYLKELGAKNIRVNQQQLTLKNGQRVGINRPDLQFDYNHRRYSVEYDSPASGRGPGHQSRLTANDPEGEVILIIIPEK